MFSRIINTAKCHCFTRVLIPLTKTTKFTFRSFTYTNRIITTCNYDTHTFLPHLFSGLSSFQSASPPSLSSRRLLVQSKRNFTNNKGPQPTFTQKKNITSTFLYISAAIIGLFGATYGSVPLYRLFCRMTGYGGATKSGHDTKVPDPDSIPEKIRKKREIVVYFSANLNKDMPWTFRPTQGFIKVIPGEVALAFYRTVNTTNKNIIGVATYNVMPPQMGPYFNKIQCFCFEEQMLKPHEEVDMPILFYIDPQFVNDPRLDNVREITLSYTFFKVEEDIARPPNDKNSGSGTSGPDIEKQTEKLQLVHQIPK